MPDVRHCDPSIDPIRIANATEGRETFTKEFYAVCNEEGLKRFEGAFLEALNDWLVTLKRTISRAGKERARVEQVIEKARKFSSGEPDVKVQVFKTKHEVRAAVAACREQRHRLKYRVDKKTLFTFMFCNNCSKELRMENGSVEI